MITMTQIAKLTGVSQPTVSRVLSGNQAVNPEIRERVLACAREHDFHPNSIAQSLVGSKTRLIGVVITDISNAFFADLVKYMEQEAGKEGYSLILFNSNYDMRHERECLDVVQRYRVDGLIVVPVNEESQEWKEAIRRLDIPTVVITRRAVGMDCVYVDHVDAGAQVGRHLVEEGYDNYIFFGDPADSKYQGFARALAEEDPESRERMTVIVSKDFVVIEEALLAHRKRWGGRTGIFAYNDRRAVQMLGILQRRGVEVPGEAGLVGFDNTYMCEYLWPALSSVSQPNEEMAAAAVRRLFYRMEHAQEGEAEDHPMLAKLIPRKSSTAHV